MAGILGILRLDYAEFYIDSTKIWVYWLTKVMRIEIADLGILKNSFIKRKKEHLVFTKMKYQ